ncbi:hypothetical protein [Streptomyces sp. TBY4]|uniref:hypothetical protein n=1 Tax=Streptomyces sp. TBY4 TaxID=2962030 RepID=UPI0020B846D4|nr:hypothetical protein [Streptomyces sp. TBY4]MCP3759194.1 hypothetical protein [Streptomyces sp. TBY4]
MRRWSPLNDRQLALLRRLDAGAELGSASTERLSAYALRDRGLLAVVRRDGSVRAEVTAAGKFYLENGRHPEDPLYTRAAELVERLVAEGRVVIPEPDEETGVEYRRAVDYAKRHNLTPPGKRIEKLRLWNRDLQISLEDGPHHNAKGERPQSAPPIPVPVQLRSLHPVVAAIKEDRYRLAVSAALRGRALRLFQGLCAEAVKRGHGVRENPMDESHRSRAYGYGGASIACRSPRREGEVDLVVGDFTYTVTIKQEFPQSEDPERAQSLMVELPYSRSGRQGKWADRKRWRLEDVLGAVLREIEVRSREDVQRRIEEKRAEEDRKVRWQAAMDSAREQADQAQLATILREQANDWHQARALSQYCDALERRIDASCGSTAPEAVSTWQWLEWARAYVSSLDPLRELPGMPVPRDLEPEELKPYLSGRVRKPFGG